MGMRVRLKFFPEEKVLLKEIKMLVRNPAHRGHFIINYQKD